VLHIEKRQNVCCEIEAKFGLGTRCYFLLKIHRFLNIQVKSFKQKKGKKTIKRPPNLQQKQQQVRTKSNGTEH